MEYKVSFGEIARTLVYEDSIGVMWFCFEIRPSTPPAKEKWILSLSPGALTPDGKMLDSTTPAESMRLQSAFERTKAYAKDRGYRVE